MKSIYRILAPILSVLLIPVIIFLPMIRANITSSLASGTNLLDNYGIGEFISLKDIISAIVNPSDSLSFLSGMFENLLNNESLAQSFESVKIYAYLFAAFLVIMLICALVAAGFAIFSKKYAVCNILTVVSLVSCFAMKPAFSALAKPFLTGEIGINSLFSGVASNSSTNILSGLMSSVAQVQTLQISYFYQVCILILVSVLILGIAAAMDGKKN